MKFKGIVTALLAVILAVNIAMAYILTTEARKQTYHAEIQSQYLLTIEEYMYLEYCGESELSIKAQADSTRQNMYDCLGRINP